MSRGGAHDAGHPSTRYPDTRALVRIFRLFIIGAAVTLAGVAIVTPAARAESVPPSSWVYEALHSFELRGLVRLEPTLPYTFDQCEAYTREIAGAVERGKIVLGPRHAFLLERLTKQFVGLRDRPEDRWSKPVYVAREDERFFATDFQVGGVLQRKPDTEKGEVDGLFNPDFLLGFGHNVTMETGYRLVMAPEWGFNANGEKASERVRSYRGLTAELDRAVLEAGGSWWNARIGREYAHWGHNLSEDLMLSQTAGSLDQFGGRVSLGRFALSMVQASLDPGGYRRHLAGHRLTVALPRGASIGLSETVVYARRDFDYMYLIPLSIFYAQQYSEVSNDDNVLWAFDWKVPLRRGLILYGQFLIDDLQYQRDENAGPDRLGLSVAADALFMVAGRELEVSGGYTIVDKYTYGHSYGTQYVAGDGIVYAYGSTQWNPLLGSTAGPDADRAFLKGTLGMSRRAALTLEGVTARYGSGSPPFFFHIPPDWQPGMDNDPAFPSPPVQDEKSISASVQYDLNHGTYISAGVRRLYRDRDADDYHTTQNLGWLEVVLDL